jgi:hypothetical protein
VLVVSAAAVLWWPKAPQAALLIPDEGPELVVNTDEAVNTWQFGGGFNQYQGVTFANNAVFEAFKAEDPAKIAESCEQARVRTEEAAAFPAPPGPEVAEAWKAVLTSVGSGARECVKIYRDGTDGDSQAMVNGFTGALPHLTRTLDLLNSARDAALNPR